jgi:hypothetical protein
MNKWWLVAVVCLLAGIRADAAALSFNVAPGDARFDATSGTFTAEGTVTASEGVSAAIAGQPFRLAAAFLGMDVDLDAGTVLAHFGGVTGDDLEVPGFLAGEFTSLDLAGAIGDDLGVLIGTVTLTGPLGGEFGDAASFISLQLNMSSPFDERLFMSPFTASLDGRVIGVAVPTGTAAPLLVGCLGLLAAAGLGSTMRRRWPLPSPGRFERAIVH